MSILANQKVLLPFNQQKFQFFREFKKCLACPHMLNFHSKTKNRQLCCLVVMTRIAVQKKTSCDYEKEKPSPVLKKFLRQSEPEPEAEKLKNLPFMA